MKILVLNSREDARRIYGDAISAEDFVVEYLGEEVPCPESILNSVRPDILLLSLEWIPQHRIISAEAARRNIPALYVMDGVLEWSYVWDNQSFIAPSGTMVQPLIASHIAVIGRHPARILASMGLREKTHIVGLPRLDEFPSTRTVHARREPAVLIACARTPSHNLEQEACLIRALSDIRATVEEMGLRAIWRIPADLAAEVRVQSSNHALEESLNEADALVTFPSTIALEGMLVGLPTAIVEYRPVPLYFDSAWQIRTKEHIYPVLNELLHPVAAKKAYQEYCLGEELEAGEATVRLQELIRKVVQGQSIPNADLAPPAHGALDFRLVHSQLSSFAASPNASLQYEIEAHRAYRASLKARVAELCGTWQIRLLRKLGHLPGFGRINRILDFFSEH
jgi:hypothetical protein